MTLLRSTRESRGGLTRWPALQKNHSGGRMATERAGDLAGDLGPSRLGIAGWRHSASHTDMIQHPSRHTPGRTPHPLAETGFCARPTPTLSLRTFDAPDQFGGDTGGHAGYQVAGHIGGLARCPAESATRTISACPARPRRHGWRLVRLGHGSAPARSCRSENVPARQAAGSLYATVTDADLKARLITV